MGPRRSTSDWSNETGYPELFYKLCKEEDVIIIPELVTHFVGRQVDSNRKSKDSYQLKSKDSKPEKITGNSLSYLNESRTEDLLSCGCIRPPQVGVVYENPDDKDTPVAVICKNFYIEYSLITSFGKSLKTYPNITCLKIENCCLGKEMAEALALLLAEEPGRGIKYLSLDGNETIAEVLPLFVEFPTGLKNLSLERCSLDDEGKVSVANFVPDPNGKTQLITAMKAFSAPLGFTDQKEHKLQILNLSMNKIGDAGLLHLAGALRTNRTLLSLSLAGNQITDEGVAHLADVLQRFELSYEEVVLRRKRIFDMIFRKKNAVEKYLEEWKTKGEVESQVSKTSIKMSERGRKIRGPDGKIRCISSRDVRNKPTTAKVNSGERFQGKNREETVNVVEPTPAEISAIMQQVENETPVDKHPFVNEVIVVGGVLCCLGSYTLKNINLAYNYLTEKSLDKLIEVIYSQNENFGPKMGLMRLLLLPGNLFHENIVEFQKLQSAIIYRQSRKGGSENPDNSLGSPMTSPKKMSLAGKKGKS